MSGIKATIRTGVFIGKETAATLVDVLSTATATDGNPIMVKVTAYFLNESVSIPLKEALRLMRGKWRDEYTQAYVMGIEYATSEDLVLAIQTAKMGPMAR